MFRAWYVPLYGYGVIHGDPHLGNYKVREDNSINLLDFGCVRIFPPSFVQGVITLYRALQTDDIDMAVEAYESWGFKNMNKDLIEILNMWARFLYGPILDNKIRAIGIVTKGIYGRETAQKVHQELRRIGGVKLPREFVFMDRAALGLGSVFLHLKSEVNWYKLFNELIEDFDLKELQIRQKKVLKQFDISITS
jgi:predicted unusual protein kinase regulating ubiquinone biosynthesis (AarF/ABC1/UbiB family)